MESARTGFCCTFVSPAGDEDEQRLLNVRQPTVASVARADVAGEAARAAGVRLSTHPAQHAILASGNPGVIDNAIHDIEEHDHISAMLGYGEGWHPHGASVNIHGGAASAGVAAIRANRGRLSAEVRNLVPIENDEISFGLDDLLQVADGVAIVVDFQPENAGEFLGQIAARAFREEGVASVKQAFEAARPQRLDVESRSQSPCRRSPRLDRRGGRGEGKNLASRDLADQLRSESTALT